jgi:hypothetical protein
VVRTIKTLARRPIVGTMEAAAGRSHWTFAYGMCTRRLEAKLAVFLSRITPKERARKTVLRIQEERRNASRV